MSSDQPAVADTEKVDAEAAAEAEEVDSEVVMLRNSCKYILIGAGQTVLWSHHHILVALGFFTSF